MIDITITLTETQADQVETVLGGYASQQHARISKSQRPDVKRLAMHEHDIATGTLEKIAEAKAAAASSADA